MFDAGKSSAARAVIGEGEVEDPAFMQVAEMSATGGIGTLRQHSDLFERLLVGP
jgi:hypothetical protein